MHILAPLNNIDYLGKMVEAGVSEVYFGFSDEAWTEQFGPVSSINRMSNFKKRANGIDIHEVPDVIRTIHGYGIKCYITLNAAQYTTEEFEKLKTYFDYFEAEKPDGVIVSGVEEARLALKRNILPVASAMCGVYNSDIAKFYEDIGISRMIFPREVTLNEMEKIKLQCPKVEFEAFFMRNGCMFSDANCLGIHSQEYGSLCATLCHTPTMIQGDRKDFNTVHLAEETSIIYHEHYHNTTCGMCALYRLNEIGIRSLKIVGRADHPEGIIRDILLTKKNIMIADKAVCESEYLNNMLFPENRFYMCKNGLSCYYPEVRFNGTAQKLCK